ncbi:hypothetical protein CDAR_429671 [Caerostris darwini]|uniref:Uncharacterized protein n=1 Tax=Caerostris darwini TaxID=1538125 RepID=A0AAV4VUJ2_9ARAC|nr:hypothetical protein CDAR_429671 [Caerostris darwini]
MEQNASAQKAASKRLLFPHKKGGVLRAERYFEYTIESDVIPTHNALRNGQWGLISNSPFGVRLRLAKDALRRATVPFNSRDSKAELRLFTVDK